MYICLTLFFFQAEDGIRDLVRSRGLGDVYKRQRYDRARDFEQLADLAETLGLWVQSIGGSFSTHASVSYTHLTLPTSDLV